eukprot:CAMPEP_0181020372 /NCGR_PEP_ID=MMETSP1070-20121207/412_1 /TAXON_ID=265543 /ORGANISM="Minutocellus polymorphus, Strain NH13" /LENGTH=117 /DNA_ID=CAMNT_0023097175 /DNA_START=278 /DNA_END=631 /DNA_ORIENTATION=-
MESDDVTGPSVCQDIVASTLSAVPSSSGGLPSRVSSHSSRRAAVIELSPDSILPPAKDQMPLFGSFPRWTRAYRTSSLAHSHLATTLTAARGITATGSDAEEDAHLLVLEKAAAPLA